MSVRGVAALLYLVCFGSIVGYSAYAYVLDRLPVAVLSIYPYVNAVVRRTISFRFSTGGADVSSDASLPLTEERVGARRAPSLACLQTINSDPRGYFYGRASHPS
jgi:hypothetical protein